MTSEYKGFCSIVKLKMAGQAHVGYNNIPIIGHVQHRILGGTQNRASAPTDPSPCTGDAIHPVIRKGGSFSRLKYYICTL